MLLILVSYVLSLLLQDMNGGKCRLMGTLAEKEWGYHVRFFRSRVSTEPFDSYFVPYSDYIMNFLCQFGIVQRKNKGGSLRFV